MKFIIGVPLQFWHVISVMKRSCDLYGYYIHCIFAIHVGYVLENSD
jgi:hypothetical protein